MAVVIGDKAGPAGTAFASGLANQRQGHPVIVAVLLTQNVAVSALEHSLSAEGGHAQYREHKLLSRGSSFEPRATRRVTSGG